MPCRCHVLAQSGFRPHIRRYPHAEKHLHSRRPRAQSQECRCRDSPRHADRAHRPVRLGQILARLRHHLCRGPAPLCREPVGLCAPVPGTDAEAGCGPYRGPVAGHFHRAEDHLQESRARPSAPSPRSTTICACCSRGWACPIRRPPAFPSKARPSARWPTASWRCRKARGFILLAPIVRGRKGEYRKELAELQKKGFQRAKVDGKYLRHRRHVPALDKKLKHDIEIVVDRIAVKNGSSATACPIPSRPRWAWPTGC